jgi:hypothetical protein
MNTQNTNAFNFDKKFQDMFAGFNRPEYGNKFQDIFASSNRNGDNLNNSST